MSLITSCCFFCSASANICNVALMRHNELSEGIDVLDQNGNVVGSSRIAAKHVSICHFACCSSADVKQKDSCSASLEQQQQKLVCRFAVRRVHIFLIFLVCSPCRLSWRRLSHVWFCPCPSLSCPPSSCPTWRGMTLQLPLLLIIYSLNAAPPPFLQGVLKIQLLVHNLTAKLQVCY